MDKSPEDQLYPATASQDEVLYDTEARSPEYDNALNQSTEPVDPEERARQEAEWKEELAKLEDEIQTLRQVLSVKVRSASDLKRRLGITPMVELRHDLKQGIQNIKDSDAYQKTSATFTSAGEKVSNSEAYQKTNQALKTVGAKTAGAFSTAGAFASKKLGDMRNSTAFKSFEEKLGGAYTNVKSRVRGSKSENNFEEALNNSSLTEEQNGGSASYPTSPMTPEEKVPL